MAAPPESKQTGSADTTLGELWLKMLPLFVAKREAIFAAIVANGLTPPSGMALTMLRDRPMRMREIADAMVCDASYVTTIVDTFERLGLATREPSATDRRVKEIALTRRGRSVADEIHGAMTAPPAAMEQLSAADRSTLARILGKLELDETASVLPHIARAGPH
jgi:DNA-binding MarR family transcriptional regulator